MFQRVERQPAERAGGGVPEPVSDEAMGHFMAGDGEECRHEHDGDLEYEIFHKFPVGGEITDKRNLLANRVMKVNPWYGMPWMGWLARNKKRRVETRLLNVQRLCR
jgi:hypothetical protein